MQQNNVRKRCAFLDNDKDSATKSVYLNQISVKKFMDPILVSPDWSDE